jgi:hypothetical protein
MRLKHSAGRPLKASNEVIIGGSAWPREVQRDAPADTPTDPDRVRRTRCLDEPGSLPGSLLVGSNPP